ncbi:MAG: (d)CMP kinase [Candidatus Limnocylindrales bacterium]
MSDPSVQPASRIVVALDGPASSGKSSVGSAAAARLGLRFVDTGLIYRALTALALREGVATDDAAALVPLVDRVALGDDGAGRLARVLLDGEDATGTIHTQEVDAAVSAVSQVPEVRTALLERQRSMAQDGGIILAGRDIGTVVLPDAPLKLYLDASVEERATRRIAERGLDPEGDEANVVREQLRTRDAQDRGRAVAPLRPADDAVVLSTDGLGFEQAVDLVAAAITRADLAAAAAPDAVLAAAPSPAPAAARSPAPAVPRVARTTPQPVAPAKRNRVIEIAMRLDNDQSLFVRMVALVARIFARTFARIRVEGLDRIPRTGPVILAANHISNFDPVVMGSWITPALKRRRIHWLGKRELFDWPGFGWIAASGGVHPVDRGTADVEAYRLATRILEAGFVLFIFPEGTRSPTGELQEAKDGLAALAMRTGATIVPIGINNSDAVWAKGHRLPSPFPRRTITVRIGEPFGTTGLVPPGTDRRAAKAIVTTAIMGRIAALLDPRHRGAYAAAIGEEPTSEP